MDKKDIKEIIKFLVKLIIFMFLGSILFVLFSGLLRADTNEFIECIVEGFFYSIPILLVLIPICLIFGVSYVIFMVRKKLKIINTDQYVRNLPDYFPPAISSLMLDLNTEITTDYTATIAYLISKKYISLEENHVVILKNDIEKLSLHERYVFDCITGKKIFRYDEFSKLLISDAQNMKLITIDDKDSKVLEKKVVKIFLITIILFIITFMLINTIIGTCLLLISPIFFIGSILKLVYEKEKYGVSSFNRTTLGRQEAKRWSGLKKYLREYTLISDKNLKDISLWQDYIPYAIALGEAKAVEKYIEENEEYRKLIYSDRYNLIKTE